MVVMTSLAPVIARSAPEIPAHAAPAIVANSMHSTTWMPCGIPSHDEPAQTATIEPDDVLALAADVEQPRAERVADGEAQQDQRRR